eukprot:CAMPEP_0119554614 /NCGR_PEP_ID=MMETSP1352-20130426/7052_1 /TAXON_ID=265584 /ORGANISM="Stauroneis constricta, Strain CCMP1120" /LENGTH=612 /DNA_ID=CAMNT_0007601229 /DNA_START=74 /DNA_END=1909 /DNA_ORIENTATION=+
MSRNAKQEKPSKKRKKQRDNPTTDTTEQQESKKRERKRQRRSNDESAMLQKRPLSFDHKYILAPMVGASELPFRLLCRKYGAQAAYTPMMSASQFATSSEYREQQFSTLSCDRPLVCHVSANDPEEFAAAARQARKLGADAIDLNLGCPQRTAFLGHFGSYLLDKKDRELIQNIIRTGVHKSKIPVCVKIRLLDTYQETKELVQQLHDAGASLIAIHARYRATWERKGPGARDGPAMLDQIAKLQNELPHVRIIANGNVITYDDVKQNLELTNADGIMSAEGLLDNPALFLGRYGSRDQRDKKVKVVDANVGDVDEKNPSNSSNNDNKTRKQKIAERKVQEKVTKWEKKMKDVQALEERAKKGGKMSKKQEIKLKDAPACRRRLKSWKEKLEKQRRNGAADANAIKPVTMTLGELYDAADDRIGLAKEYLALVRKYPAIMRTVIFHTRRICKSELTQYQLMEECLACKTVDEVDAILTKIKGYQQDPPSFQYDKEKAKREKDALARKKFEEGKRKRFEERMMRKAKREGKELDFYLKQGASVPTQATIDKLRTMDKKDQVQLWKNMDHSQHCLGFHLNSCTRGRSCAFLHMELNDGNGANGANNFEEADAVA